MLAVGGIGYYLTFLGRAATPDPVGATFKLFAPGWRSLGGESNEDNVKYFKYIFGHNKADKIPGIASDAKVIKYSLGPYAVFAQTPCDLITDNAANRTWMATYGFKAKCGTSRALPKSAFARGLSTNEGVYARQFANVLFSPNDPETLKFVQEEAGRITAGFDGLLSDSMGVAPLRAGYVNEVSRVPGTTRAYMSAEWLSAQREMMAAKSRGVGAGKVLVFNGLAKGDEYFAADSAAGLIDESIYGAMAERIFREPHEATNTWRSVASWEKDIEMIKDVEAKDKVGFWWTKCWSESNACTKETGDTAARITQVRRFAIASFLLGAGEKSYFNFDQNRGDSNAAEFYEDDYARAYSIKLASAPYEKTSEGLYTRKFSNGLVIANPTDNDLTYNLGSATLKNFDNVATTGTFTVKAHTGHVLTGVVTVPTPPDPDPDEPAGTPGGDSTKARLVGYVDKDGVPDAAYRTHLGKPLVNNYTVNVYWDKIENVKNNYDFTSIQSQIDAVEAVGGNIRLRIFAGRSAPAWVKSEVGTVRWVESREGGSVPLYQLPKFWTEAYQGHYTKFLTQLSNRYDSNPRIGEVTAAMCMTTWAEPFLRQSAYPENKRNAIAGGYTYAADLSCQRNTFKLFDTRSGVASAGKLFPNTRITVAANPFQGFNPPSGANPLNNTLSILKHCRTVLGGRCVLGNNSLRSTSQGADYNKLYTFEKNAGKPLYYQLEFGSKVGDYQQAIKNAVSLGAYSVEFSNSDYKSYNKAKLAELLKTFPAP